MKESGILIVAVMFLLATACTGSALAKTTCTVTAVAGSNVTMDCGDKAGDFDAGMQVNVKAKKAKKAIEGC